MAAVETKSGELIERTCFPLIKKKHFCSLSATRTNDYSSAPNILIWSGYRLHRQEKGSQDTAWIGSGAMKGCRFYIAYSLDRYSKFPLLARLKVAHVLPWQYVPSPAADDKYDHVVLITSSESCTFNAVGLENSDHAQISFRHFNIEVQKDAHIYVYFNRYTGALCIEAPDALYMSKESLFYDPMSDSNLQDLKNVFLSARFNKGRIGFPGFTLFQTISAHAAKMKQANTFEEVRAIAREALQSEKPFLGRDPQITDCYHRIANSSSAIEAIRNLSQQYPGVDKIFGENTERSYESYLCPSYNKHAEEFIESFGGSEKCGLPISPQKS